jgi:hypothetical protein
MRGHLSPDDSARNHQYIRPQPYGGASACVAQADPERQANQLRGDKQKERNERLRRDRVVGHYYEHCHEGAVG